MTNIIVHNTDFVNEKVWVFLVSVWGERKERKRLDKTGKREYARPNRKNLTKGMYDD